MSLVQNLEKKRRSQMIYMGVSLVTLVGIYALVSNLYLLAEEEGYFALEIARPAILPPIQHLFSKLIRLLSQGDLQKSILVSVRRVIIGYCIGALLGISLGILMGWVRKVELFLDPVIEFIRPIPALCFVTLVILWVGIGELSKILIIIEGVSIQTLIPTYHGIRDVPKVYLEAASSLGASRRLVLRKVAIPYAMPYIFSGLRVSLAVAWAIIVAAEYIASVQGIGYLINLSRRVLDIKGVMVGIAFLSMACLASSYLVRYIGDWVTRWMEK